MIGNGPPAGEKAPCAVRLFTKQTALQNREPQDNAPGKKTRGLATRGERAGCTEFPYYTLNRNRITSPSATTYSLPSARMAPTSLAAASEPYRIKSS